MVNIRGWVILVGAVPFVLGAKSQASESRRTHFLSDGPASIGGTLGGAMTAYPEDASAVYWNPAGLSGQNSNIFVDHQNTNTDAATSWLGVAGGNRRMKYGLNWKHQQLPLDSNKDAILIGLGIDQSIIPWLPKLSGLSLGTTLGRVSEKISGSSADSYLIDVGALWRGVKGPWKLSAGGVVKNLYFGGLTFEDGTEEEKWPQELRAGLSINRWGVTGLIDAQAFDSQFQTLYGLEYELGKIIRLRAGYNEDISYGIGVNYKNIGLAFGYQTGEIQNKPSGSISYTWGPKEEVDYTNPLAELEARHQNLESYLLVEVRSDIQSGKKLELKKILQLLAVSPKNPDAWVLLESITGEKRVKAKIPQSKRARRDYLAFAVAYANSEPEATDNAILYLKKYPRANSSDLIRLIQKHESYIQIKTEEKKSDKRK